MKLYIDGIEVELVRKSVKNINLTVLPPDGRVRVSAPHFVPEVKIFDFVSSKSDWIREKREQLASLDIRECEYKDGDTLFVLGKPYILRLKSGRETLLSDGEIFICERDTEHYYNEYLRECLADEIEFLLPIWEERTGLYPSAWSIKNMRTRWGSCNTVTGKIWFSLGLGKKDPECIEYVILHELTHLCERGHGERFRAIMDEYMPAWRDVKQKLNMRERYDEI